MPIVARLMLSLKPMPLGRWGEWVALSHVLSKGYDVLARNWKSGRGELDLIAFDGDTLAFIEVKTRKAGGLHLPEFQISQAKQSQLERMANRFRVRYECTDDPVRFDLIAIETPDRYRYDLRHYQGFM